MFPSIGEDISRDLDEFFADPANTSEAWRVAFDARGVPNDLQTQFLNQLKEDEKTREGIDAFNLVMNQVTEDHEMSEGLADITELMSEAFLENVQQELIVISSDDEHDLEEDVAQKERGAVVEKSGEVSGNADKVKNKKHAGKKLEVSSTVKEVKKNSNKQHDNAATTMEQAGTSQSSHDGNHPYNIRKTTRLDYKKLVHGTPME